jgi:protein phosphatase
MIAINTSQPCIGFADTRQGGRAENQDTCAYSETPLGLLVTVCDGMGGGPSGKLASTIAASNIIATLTACQSGDDRVEALRRAVINANIALYQAMEADP